MKLVMFAFAAAVVSRVAAEQEVDSLLQTTSMKGLCEASRGEACVPWKMAAAVYGFPSSLDPSYVLEMEYTINEGNPNKDAAWLYNRCGHCTMVFNAADSGLSETLAGNPTGDWGNIINFTPIDRWGLSGVHAGVATELEGLVNLMDFKQIRRLCGGSFSVAGSSLGGALAQLFAVLLTKDDDPLGAGLALHEVNTFGSFAAMVGPARNSKSVDGCFAGTQYWYAEPTPDGLYAVDTVYGAPAGALVHEPIRGNKVFTVVADTGVVTNVKYECGTALPNAVDLLAYLQGNFTEWGPRHTGYNTWLGCDSS